MMPIQDDLDKCNNNGGNDGHSGTSGNSSNTDGGHSQHVGVQSNSAVTPTLTMTKAELRKSNKPIMEKKRRARINHCLNELKTLILEAMKKDPARHTKLEKADILEMTVKHLQTIQRQQFAMAVNTDPTVIHKFKSGFTDCAEEVTRYVNQMDGLDSGVKQRLANHLNNCVSNIQQLAPPLSFPQPPTGVSLSAFPGSIPMHGTGSSSSVIPMPQDVNNNGRIQMGGVQLIPSRLPTGELALVMPNSSNLSFFPSASPFSTPAPPPPSNLDLGAAYARSSAFSSVSRPAATRHSPPLSPVSSISSCGEDSHHSSDYQNSTASPPLVPSCSAATLPSNLQQPQVSSTTETQRARLESKPDIHYVNKKRPYPFDVSESTASKYEISAKAIKLETRGEPGPNFDHNQNSAQNGNTSADMWRPW